MIRTDRITQTLVDVIHDATGVQTLYGPRVGEVSDEAVIVGLPDPDRNRGGVQVQVTRDDGLGRPRLTAVWSVACLVTVLSGGTDTPPVHTRAEDLLAQIDTAVRDRAHLPGVWDTATVAGQGDVAFWSGEDGAAATIAFRVEGTNLL